MHKRGMNRREFLRLAAVTAAGAALPGCSIPGDDPDNRAGTATPSRTALPRLPQVDYPAGVLPDRFIGIYTSWWGGTKEEERAFIDDLIRRASGLDVSVINLNFAWSALQPEETVCDFDHMQDLITRIKRGGMQCVLRVYGMMAEMQLWPEWLHPRLVDVYPCPGMYVKEVLNPTPWDSGYQEAFALFLQQLGAWFRQRAAAVPDGYQISLGGAYGEMYLGCYTHYEPYVQEQINLTNAGMAAVNAHHAALADVIPDLILMSEELVFVINRAVELGIHWIQRNEGARDTLYPRWNDKIPTLKLFPSSSFILEDEMGWSNYKLPLQSRVDLLREIQKQKDFRFQGIFLHSHDIMEANRAALTDLRAYLDGK